MRSTTIFIWSNFMLSNNKFNVTESYVICAYKFMSFYSVLHVGNLWRKLTLFFSKFVAYDDFKLTRVKRCPIYLIYLASMSSMWCWNLYFCLAWAQEIYLLLTNLWNTSHRANISTQRFQIMNFWIVNLICMKTCMKKIIILSVWKNNHLVLYLLLHYDTKAKSYGE